MENKPIGIFDSGLGGLTIVKEVFKQLPKEKVIYLADNFHIPYGDRQLNEVKSFALEIISFLVKKGVKLIIIGCHISSAISLEEAKKRFKIPIIGLVKIALSEAIRKNNSSLGLIATRGTIKSGVYPKVVKNISPKASIYTKACPKLVPLIEAGEIDTLKTKNVVKNYLKIFQNKKLDTLILGCTHYPFLKKVIIEILPKSVKILDPAPFVVKEARNVLKEKKFLNISNSLPEHIFYITGEKEKIVDLGSKFLGRKIKKIKKVCWENNSLIERR